MQTLHIEKAGKREISVCWKPTNECVFCYTKTQNSSNSQTGNCISSVRFPAEKREYYAFLNDVFHPQLPIFCNMPGMENDRSKIFYLYNPTTMTQIKARTHPDTHFAPVCSSFNSVGNWVGAHPSNHRWNQTIMATVWSLSCVTFVFCYYFALSYL